MGNWKPTPISTDVKRTVVNRRLISKTLPMPNETDLARKISICHFIMIAPNAKPIEKRKKDNGRNSVIVFSSFLFNAGLRKEII